MFALSKTTGYGILALCCVAYRYSRRVFGRTIAECTDIPKPYLTKILSSLVEAGLLDGKRGYRGGFRLSRPPSDVSVEEIVDALEGVDWDQRCLLGLDCCTGDHRCPTHDFWLVTKHQIRTELSRLRLDEVAAFEHRAGRAAPCCPVGMTDENAEETPLHNVNSSGAVI